ncbi:hypothetical protein CK203_105730 [Vitis vinifera]|uniref:Uncharacterized protein n=1 Tax=Vitis vinifera TaxID=29760 RepID=A0A438FKD6_VITVI|nr:hypothetical protein CK203_105730 [Vitis vinifera]
MAILYALVARGPWCFLSSAPSPATLAPSLVGFLRSCLPRPIPGSVSRRIATYSTYSEPMDSRSFAWPTTPSEFGGDGSVCLSSSTSV